MPKPTKTHLQRVLERRSRFFPIPFTASPEPAMQMIPAWKSRGYLPHIDDPRLIQSLTFRLGDSLPAHVLRRMDDTEDECQRRRMAEEGMDRCHGACWLGRPDVARWMEDALLRFDGERYRLLAWCVMPNHVHVLIQPLDVSLGVIVGSWKGWVSHRANRLLGRKGRFWREDYWDRFIRDACHLGAVIRYIERNPVKAGLVADGDPRSWPWSSARWRG